MEQPGRSSLNDVAEACHPTGTSQERARGHQRMLFLRVSTHFQVRILGSKHDSSLLCRRKLLFAVTDGPERWVFHSPATDVSLPLLPGQRALSLVYPPQ